MAEPQIGSRDSQGRYYHGPVKGYMSLSDLMKDYNKKMGPGLFGIKQGETRNLPGVGDIMYDQKYGWQTKATYERGLIEPSKRPPKPDEPTSGMSAAELKAAQDAANKARQQGKLSDLRGASTDAEVKKPEVKQPEVKQPEVKKPESKPTLDPKLKADLDKFAPKINQNWAAANERLARVELARAQQRAAGKSVFDKQFRQTKVNPIMYKQPSVEKEAYDVVLDYLLSEGHADSVEEAHYVMMQMDAEYIQSIVEGFPATGPVRVDPAQKLKLQQDPSGRKYYTGPGGREMSPTDVDKVMRGDLMVKKQKPQSTTQMAHYEPEGEVIGEGDPSFQIKKSSGVRALSADAAKQLGPRAEQLRKNQMGKVGLPKLPGV